MESTAQQLYEIIQGFEKNRNKLFIPIFKHDLLKFIFKEKVVCFLKNLYIN